MAFRGKEVFALSNRRWRAFMELKYVDSLHTLQIIRVFSRNITLVQQDYQI